MKKTIHDTKFEIIDEEEVRARKANYWRGFRACLILVVAPIVLIIIAVIHIWVMANI